MFRRWLTPQLLYSTHPAEELTTMTKSEQSRLMHWRLKVSPRSPRYWVRFSMTRSATCVGQRVDSTVAGEDAFVMASFRVSFAASSAAFAAKYSIHE